MDAAIRRLVGERRRAQQVEAQQAVLRPVAVLAVVEQGEARLVVLHRDPLVRADLELGLLDRVALGRRPPDVAELDLAQRGVAVVSGEELGAQHPVLLVPVHVRLEAHDVAARLEDHALVDRDLRRPVHVVAHHPRALDARADLADGERLRLLLAVALVDVPRVERELEGVLEHDEAVQAGAGVLRARRHRCTRRSRRWRRTAE